MNHRQNPNQLSPAPQFPERARQTYDEIIATPRRNAIGHRAGERYAEEGLGWEPSYSGAFVGGLTSTPGVIEVKEAGQASGRGRLGSGQQIPAWDAVAPEALANFAGAADFGDPGRAVPFTGRGGAVNPNTISPLDGLARGERQGTTMVTKIALPIGGRGRANNADVSSF